MTKTNILIIEDNRELGHVFLEILQTDDCHVELIRDGQAALDYLGQHQPDIVILDMHLPHVSGHTILHYIRSESRLAQVQVVIVTANIAIADILTDHADLVLVKPVSYSQLSTIVSRLSSTNQ